MQAPVLKHTTPKQFVGFALAIGFAASLALSAATLTRSNDDGAAGVNTRANISLVDTQQHYYDAKTARIEALDAAAGAAYSAALSPSSGSRAARLRDARPTTQQAVAGTAWGQHVADRADQIEATRMEAERYTSAAEWGRFLEERNAQNDAAWGTTNQVSDSAAANSFGSPAGKK
jgi:hypothetical protein